MRVPPNVSAGDYAKVLAEFARVIGKEWVFTSDEDLDLYRDAFSPFLNEPEEKIASGALAPVSTEQVQQIVRIANQYRIPLYPISTGKNLGYGGSAPAYSGSVVLDLKRMNRIIEVNEQHAFALVEPGVSYFDLYRYIQEHKLKVWIDCPDPGWGSVMGNALDRGGGYTTANYRNHFDSHCGMEIVLPDGELLRTGMGAIPNAQTWQQYKSGCGPWIDGIFSQSNYGVVTKMGFWLMPEPEAYQRCTVSVPRYQDLIPLVEILNFVENSRITSGFPDLESPLLGYPPVGQIQLWNETGPPKMSPEHLNLMKGTKLGFSPEIEAYGAHAGIPYWRLWLSFHGAEEVIEAQWRAAQRHFARIDGGEVRGGRPAEVAGRCTTGHQVPRTGTRGSLPAGLLHRGPHPLESHAFQGPYVVLAHHSAHRPGDHRGEPRVQRGGQVLRHAALQHFHAAGMLLGALLHLHPRDPGHRGPEDQQALSRGVQETDRDRRAARLGRVSHGSGVPEGGHGRVLLQQPCFATFPRHAEGRNRPQWDPLGRTL